MKRNFNKYVLYVDSTQTTKNFDSLNTLKKYVSDMLSVSKRQIKFDESKLDKGENSNVLVYSKFGYLIKSIGFVYKAYWD